MIYKGDCTSFQCKMSLNWNVLMKEIDGLSLIFIDDVPALTPRLHRRERVHIVAF